MSRHRNVRGMNYEDEYDGYDDVYGHSVEDDCCISPGTAHQYMFDRSGPMAHFEPEEELIEEELPPGDQLLDSSKYVRPVLSPIDEARLNSCLEELRNILGESTPDHVMIEAVIAADYQYENALNSILNTAETPKDQRPRRERRNRASGAGSDVKASVDVTMPGNAPRTEPAPFARPTSDAAPPCSEFEDIVGEAGVDALQRRLGNLVTLPPADPPVPVKRPHIEDDQTPDSGDELTAVNGCRGADGRDPTRLDAPSRDSPDRTPSPRPPRAQAKSEADILAAQKEFEDRRASGKDCINLVVIGHVDAGKSTLMGHVLYQLGFVSKKIMHKYETEARKQGKASFAFAWVLDETDEERSRGVTMDVAQTRFETANKSVTLLDAPGHRDFIPNMITGAAQADVAVLVVNAARGEFETGFELGGQTREHAVLIRSLGVSQLVVAINKLDTVDWAQERVTEIDKKLRSFLKTVGFRDSDVSMVPVSGLTGQNLTVLSEETSLRAWYSGPCLVEAIDRLSPPQRAIDKPLRMCVSDVFKGVSGGGMSLAGTLHAGAVAPGDRVLVMPCGDLVQVKSVLLDGQPARYAFAGDTAVVVVTGLDPTSVAPGSVICEPANPVPCSQRIVARVVIFQIEVPITRGFPVVFHHQSLSEPATIRKLVSQLHKSTGEVVRNKPRCLTKNSSAVVEVELGRPVCLELYKDFRDLGRFMLRHAGRTIGAGLVTEIKSCKNSKAEKE